jgi:hypothetical protein
MRKRENELEKYFKNYKKHASMAIKQLKTRKKYYKLLFLIKKVKNIYEIK